MRSRYAHTYALILPAQERRGLDFERVQTLGLADLFAGVIDAELRTYDDARDTLTVDELAGLDDALAAWVENDRRAYEAAERKAKQR